MRTEKKHRASLCRVRALRKADIPAFIGLFKELARLDDVQLRLSEADVLEHCFGRRKSLSVFVAVKDNALVGFATVNDWANFFLGGAKMRHLSFLYVAEAYRQQGVATALIRHVISDARASNCLRVTVQTELDNEAANSTYVRTGFAVVDDDMVRYRLKLEK